MTVPYQLDELLDNRNRPLYEEVIRSVSVRFEPSDDSGWGCKLDDGGGGVVYCSKSKHPIACFTHELLHLKFESQGMGRPYFKTDVEDFPVDAIGFFHNQLVHQKIYAPFVGLGFQPGEFLNDDDSQEMMPRLGGDLKTLENLYKKGRKPLEGLMVALLFFSLRSPHDTSERVRAYERRLKAIAEPQLVLNLDRILRDWEREENPNCSKPLARIFKAAGYPRVGFTLTGLESDCVYAATVSL